MIIDRIENASLYYGMGDRIEKALKFLQQTNFSETPKGKYELDGSNLYYMLQEYSTKTPEEGKWEAHRKYADIQFVVSGTERMGVADIGNFAEATGYDEAADIQFLKGNGDFFKMQPGSFAVLFPSDVHMPGIRLDESAAVRKAVMKVRL